MTTRYTVRISKDEIGFCGAHFITYEGDQCERIHGHNYRVSAEVAGPLDKNQYVFDFIALKDQLKAITGALDHRMLVPTKSPLIRVEVGDSRVALRSDDEQVTLLFENRKWSFPRDDCVLLPVENTTAELLAKFLGEQLRQQLRSLHKWEPDSIRIELEESPGQSAMYEWRR
ncbi:MAG: 6-pyruvoyl trahydropterin synthase family protein [Gemmataceae bacterium]